MELPVAFVALILLASLSSAQLDIRQDTKPINLIPWDDSVNFRLNVATIVTREMKAELVDKLSRGGHRIELDEYLGNTIFALAFDGFKLWDKIEPHYRDAIYNGVLCDNITDIVPEDDIRKMLYGLSPTSMTQQHKANEEKNANDRLFGIDCLSPSSDSCFCQEKKLLFYCLALRMERKIRDSGFLMKKCDHEIFGAYKFELGKNLTNGVNNYIEMFNHHYLGKYDDRVPLTTDIFDGRLEASKLIFTSEPENETAEFYCEAMEPRAAIYVKQLYAANPVRWTLERELYTLYGPLRVNVYLACLNNANFTSTEFGSCLCAFDTGFTFCFYKTIAKIIQQEGFLDCKTMTFNRTINPSLELAFAMPASSMAVPFFLSAVSILFLLLLNH